MTEEKSKVAETLDEFRGNYRYNLLDENVRRFNAEVPQIWQWDDHEVTNNWSPAQGSARQRALHGEERRRCSSRARRHAFLEYAPLRSPATRSRARLPHDPATVRCSTCSCSTCAATAARTAPTCRRRRAARPRSSAAAQLAWLKRGAARARSATWKVIAADMPLGLVVPTARRERPGPVRGGRQRRRRAARARARDRRPAALHQAQPRSEHRSG